MFEAGGAFALLAFIQAGPYLRAGQIEIIQLPLNTSSSKTFGTIFWNSFSKCQAAFAHANRGSAGLSGTYSPLRACAKQLCLVAVCFSAACESFGRRRQKLPHYDTKA